MRFIELFAGIGGFRYGLEQSGFSCVWANEIDKYACQVYRKQYGKGELYEGDITTVSTGTIPDHDLLVGGFPCQSFSIAGKRGGFEDTRGTLFFEIARIVSVKRPKLLLLENVKGLLSHNSGRTFATILSTLSDLGYVLEWQVLNSKNFGVPQNRERVFIIGHLRGESRGQIFPIGESNQADASVCGKEKYTTMIHQGVLRKGEFGNGKKEECSFTLDGTCGRDLTIHNTQPRSPNRPSLKYSSGGSGHLQRNDGITYCLDSGSTNAVEENTQIRRLTETECERLQGFPDNWTNGISSTQRYKCLGNAVTTNVIRAIGERIGEA